MTPLEGFLLGVIATASVTAALFFLKFWRSTRDALFLAFAAFFLIQAVDRIALLFFQRPNEGSPWIYLVRLVALLLIVAAILKKNYGASR
ncbi:MAG TPA: DUF5985 family protein [Candidatus Acidoferrales bacterium]|jgi:uncharacterized membrane protein HdeD (DUF308 family)|nr:DUF5985 family protein [Candidatus Acidoferrales bacterium]